MDYINYFKSQAKKFYKDFQTQYKVDNDTIYDYKPKFWPDINEIIVSYDIDEDDFSLMKAQHIIALLANFKDWDELIHANKYLHEIGYYLIEYRENDFLDVWQSYNFELKSIVGEIDDESKLDILKHTFIYKN